MYKKNFPITYSSSGVDIKKGNQFVDEIKPIISKTKIPGADVDIGGFGGLFDIMKLNYRSFIQVVILGSSSYEPFMKMKEHQKQKSL